MVEIVIKQMDENGEVYRTSSLWVDPGQAASTIRRKSRAYNMDRTEISVAR